MTTQDHPTLDQVLRLARQLPPADQARLVARLTPTLAAVLEEYGAAPVPSGDPRALLARLREDFRTQGPVSPSMAEDLAAARR
jgi:hypothetical protein